MHRQLSKMKVANDTIGENTLVLLHEINSLEKLVMLMMMMMMTMTLAIVRIMTMVTMIMWTILIIQTMTTEIKRKAVNVLISKLHKTVSQKISPNVTHTHTLVRDDLGLLIHVSSLL